MKELQLYQKPVFIKFEIQQKTHAEGFRPDLKKAAKDLATYLLENGFIAFHGPKTSLSSDAFEYSAVIYCYKPERGFP